MPENVTAFFFFLITLAIILRDSLLVLFLPSLNKETSSPRVNTVLEVTQLGHGRLESASKIQCIHAFPLHYAILYPGNNPPSLFKQQHNFSACP